MRAKIDSFIATLGMSSILLALIAWVSSGQQILDLPASFQKIATGELLGLAYPVWIMLAVGLDGLVRGAADADGAAGCTPPAATPAPRGWRACRPRA